MRTLPFEDVAQLGRERKHPAVPVLRLARLKAEPARVEVDMVPLARQEFGPDAPSGDVRDPEDGLQIVDRQVDARGGRVLYRGGGTREPVSGDADWEEGRDEWFLG